MAENEPFLTFVDPEEIPETSGISEVPVQIEPAIEQQPSVIETPLQPQALVRTYHKDVSGVMGQNNPRVMSDLLASAHSEEADLEAKNPISPKNKNYIIGSAVLLLLGLSVLGFAVYRNYATVQALQQAQQLSLIRAEAHTNVTLADNETFKNRAKVTQALAVQVPLQTINHIFFTRQTITGLSQVSFTETVALTGGTIPIGLAATLDPNFMYGTYQSDTPLPFLILRVNTYDNAFAGMRAWEPLMIDHLGFLFNLPEVLRSNFNKSTFEDRIISNHAVRAVIYHSEPIPTQTEIESAIVAVAPDITTEPALGSNEGENIPIETATPVAPTETPAESQPSQTEPILPPQEPIEGLSPVSETLPQEALYQEGDTVLMYTFLNEHTILIATSEAVMREILFRLTNAQLLL